MTTETITPTRTRRRGLTPYLTLAAGALFVAVPPIVELVTYDAFALMGLAGVLVLAALPGLRRQQRGADGRAGSWGLRLTMGGLGTLVLLILSGDLVDAVVSGGVQTVVEAVFMLVGGAATLALLLGIVLFSVGMTRARVFPPAAIWVFLGGMVLALVSELLEQSLQGPVPWLADTLPPLGFVVAGFGLLTIGRAALDVAPERRT
jgi:hypothetical protein